MKLNHKINHIILNWEGLKRIIEEQELFQWRILVEKFQASPLTPPISIPWGCFGRQKVVIILMGSLLCHHENYLKI